MIKSVNGISIEENISCNSNEESKDPNTMNVQKTKATIKSLPIDVVIMIIEMLSLWDALELCKVLNLPEQVAAQYCSIDENEINATLYVLYNFKLKPNSFKYLLKNKGFQTGSTDLKTLAALKTFDLDFVRRYIEEVKPDLQRALLDAVQIGFSDGVKLFLSDPRVDPGARDNEPLFYAAAYGHVQVIKILLSDCRVDSSTLSNQILINAAQEGHAEAVKTLLSHPRVELLAETIKDALYFAKKEGHAEAVKVLQSYVKD